MQHPMLECPSCRGSGKVGLTPPLMETYQLISRLGRASIPQVWKQFKRTTTQSGANRRVNRLLKLGLIKPVSEESKVTRYSVM